MDANAEFFLAFKTFDVVVFLKFSVLNAKKLAFRTLNPSARLFFFFSTNEGVQSSSCILFPIPLVSLALNSVAVDYYNKIFVSMVLYCNKLVAIIINNIYCNEIYCCYNFL